MSSLKEDDGSIGGGGNGGYGSSEVGYGKDLDLTMPKKKGLVVFRFFVFNC